MLGVKPVVAKFIVVTPLAAAAAHFTPPVTLESAVNTCSLVPSVKFLGAPLSPPTQISPFVPKFGKPSTLDCILASIIP